MADIFLALGTNLGDREKNLSCARERLGQQVSISGQSPVYQSEPWGYTDQPLFLNQVLRGETSLPAHDLLKSLKAIEAGLGRVPTFRYGPRLIDIDILFYDHLILETPELTIPHPKLHERDFVLVPLADLAPEWVHPVLHKSIRTLLAGLPGPRTLTRFNPET